MLLDEGTCLFNFDPHQVGAPISCDYVKFLFVHYFKLDLNIYIYIYIYIPLALVGA